MGSFQDYVNAKVEEGVRLRGRVPPGFQVRTPEEELAGPTDQPKDNFASTRVPENPRVQKPVAQGYSSDNGKFNFKTPTANLAHAETGLARLRGMQRTPEFSQTINTVNNMDDEEKYAIFKLLQKQFAKMA